MMATEDKLAIAEEKLRVLEAKFRAEQPRDTFSLEEVRNAMEKSDLSIRDVELTEQQSTEQQLIFTHDTTRFVIHRQWIALSATVRYDKSVDKKAVPNATLAMFLNKWNEDHVLGKAFLRPDAVILQFSLPFPFTEAQLTPWLRHVLMITRAFEGDLVLSCYPKQTAMDILDNLDKKLQATPIAS